LELPPDFERRCVRWLLVWSAALATAHVVFNLTWTMHSSSAELKALFGLNYESSLASWTSIVTMALLGLACLGVGARRGLTGWKWSGAFFLYLSLDDGSKLHERLGWWSGVGDDGGAYAWTKVVLPVIGALGACVLVYLWRATRGEAAARRHVLAAFVLWGLALALEVPEMYLRDSGRTLRDFSIHLYFQVAEEWCELVAPGVMLAGVLTLLRTGPRSTDRT
jgi:hypothetical protein